MAPFRTPPPWGWHDRDLVWHSRCDPLPRKRTEMKAHSSLIRTLLLSALGVPFFACSGRVETCTSCDSGDGDRGGDGDGDGDGDIAGDGDVGGDGDIAGDGDGDGPTSRCTNPTPIEGSNGFVMCEEGFSHRPESVACPDRVPRDEVIEWPPLSVAMGGAGGGDPSYTTSEDECSTDHDCGADEICRLIQTNPPFTGLCGMVPTPVDQVPDYARICDAINPGCVTDDDCGVDQVCLCGEYRGECSFIPAVAGCRTDADCAGEALCLADYSCQKPGDECYTSADCPAGFTCILSADALRSCIAPHPTVCGRPYLVAGTARLADAARCVTWKGELGEVVVPSDPRLRSALAEHFTELALMEHASIAAFARFTLQLLSLGAPADLIEGSNEALIDETRHARLGFALASAYAGESIGPGALGAEHALDDFGVEAVFEATLREGCIGETRAALEATWAAERCADPVVREILEGISRDETRHAELAWRTVSWMIRERPELGRLAVEVFESTAVRPQKSSHRPEHAQGWGVLSSQELSICWEEAWNKIVLPCARALLTSVVPRASLVEPRQRPAV